MHSGLPFFVLRTRHPAPFETREGCDFSDGRSQSLMALSGPKCSFAGMPVHPCVYVRLQCSDDDSSACVASRCGPFHVSLLFKSNDLVTKLNKAWCI